MAAYRLHAQDAVVQISLGGEADGSAPVYTTALVMTGMATDVKVADKVETTQFRAPGDTRVKHRTKWGSSEITIKRYVLSTGATYRNMVGQYAKVEIKELSSMATFEPAYEGIITSWDWGYGDDEQAENITITCDAEHA